MYYKQLDSLRALAVMMVIIFHWGAISQKYILPLGSWGVELFFVLSGFLITKILLESRLSAQVRSENKLHVLKNFVVRRSLRIFPIYYLALLIILIFDRTNISGLRNNLSWFAGYASNFFFFKTQQWSYPMAHFWTLAVEEQFYLFWPWFILFLPWKYLKSFFIISIVVAILSRLIFSGYSSGNVTVEVLTPACIDCFSIGALFSIYMVDKKYNINQVIAVINKLGISCFLIVIILLITRVNTFSFLHRTFDSVFFLCLIANAVKGFKGLAGLIASNSIIIYIGKISYGLYIYHLLTPWLTMIFFNILNRFKIKSITVVADSYYHAGLLIKFTIDLIILIIVASASWYLIEKPFNRLKRLFKDKRITPIPDMAMANADFNYSITNK